MSLKPINLIQAAKADLSRRERNTSAYATTYEHYAFHRLQVRRAETPCQFLTFALMSPPLKLDKETGETRLDTTKTNTKLIYGNAQLLVAALRMLEAQ